ncbi:hypothetical protein RCL1_003775 [Eukaryota sp. TZLM3-RCL]
MDSQVEIDVSTFFDHVTHFYSLWEQSPMVSDESSPSDFSAILVPWGQAEVPFALSLALQVWLVGFEAPNSVFLFTKSALHILSGPKKAKLFSDFILGEDSPARPENFPNIEIHIHSINKQDSDAENISILHQAVLEHGTTLGLVQGDKHLMDTPFLNRIFEGLVTHEINQFDCSPFLTDVLTYKDSKEIKSCARAAKVSAQLISSILIPKVEDALNKDKKVKHKTLSKAVSDTILDPTPLKLKINANHLDQGAMPLVQSGGKYDPYAVNPDTGSLSADVIVLQTSARYRYYCSLAARTLFINPEPSFRKAYGVLNQLRDFAMETIKSGHVISELVSKIHDFSRQLLATNDLVDWKFDDSIGFLTGLLFQFPNSELNSSNDKILSENSVIILRLVINLIDSPTKFWMADTLFIDSDGATLLTEDAPVKWKEVSYNLEAPEPEEKEAKTNKKQKGPAIPANVIAGANHRPATRSQKDETELEQLREDRLARSEHQSDLWDNLLEFNQRKYSEGGAIGEDIITAMKELSTYSKFSELPRQATGTKIIVDPSREAVLFPIRGQSIPVHISAIKSISKSDEGKDHFLRFNFNAPGTATLAQFMENAEIPHIKLLAYGSRSGNHINETYRAIKELQKRSKNREKQIQEEASLVVQDSLKLARGRPIVMRDVIMRPNISGRKTTGILEIHANGIRFTSIKKEVIDILFSNIRVPLFQAAESDLLVILHFHLKFPIMVGKKKQKDIQFVKEVVPESASLDSTTQARGRREADELQEEEREKRRKMELNSEFFNFAKKVEEASDLEFDVPYRELAFDGVPYRSTVTMIPSVHTLLSLSESPFFVLALEDVEIVFFERVSFSYASFDMVFIFKDYSIPPAPIKAVSSKKLDDIKDWLNSVDIKYFETPSAYNWEKLMAQIKESPQQFWEDNGWTSLGMGDNEPDTDDSMDEGDDAFSLDEDDLAADPFDEGLSLSEEESEFGEDEVDTEDEGETDEEGLTWEELEEQALREDEARLSEVPQAKRRRR